LVTPLGAVGEGDRPLKSEQADLAISSPRSPWSAPWPHVHDRVVQRARGMNDDAGSSIAGVLSGWEMMVVMPPAAAA
jgi:hypothetical protein